MGKTDIRSMNLKELEAVAAEMGQPRYRGDQLFKWLQAGVSDFSQMSDIPGAMQGALSEKYYIADVKTVRRLQSKKDKTVKYLFELYDGERIETVLMKYEHGYTVCISTQVGCRMGCSFCASGINGLVRNLTASEMLAQITAVQNDNGIRVSNIVMMGMGEPLDNFENSVRFLQLVSKEKGLNIGLRHISLSTSGVVSGIRRLKEYGFPITLSISLHAPDDKIRSSIMKVNNSWNIEELLNACREYQKVTTRRISFEYALIEGVNDSRECADKLAARLKGIMCHVNLIPANPINENTFRKPDKAKINKFRQWLTENGVNATIRRTLGSDIDASCGQLRRRTEEGDST